MLTPTELRVASRHYAQGSRIEVGRHFARFLARAVCNLVQLAEKVEREVKDSFQRNDSATMPSITDVLVVTSAVVALCIAVATELLGFQWGDALMLGRDAGRSCIW